MDVRSSALWIYGLGFTAQAFFGMRLIIQWYQSERKGIVVSPLCFWYASLAGSSLFMLYGLLRFDPVIVFAQVVSHFIYIRNLQLKRVWSTMPRSVRLMICLVPLLILALLAGSSARIHSSFAGTLNWIVVTGAVGQFFLSFRFVVQLYYAEQQKMSLFPHEFWVISIVAGLFIIVYAWFRSDPVLLIVQSGSLLVYLRNLFLLRQPRTRLCEDADCNQGLTPD